MPKFIASDGTTFDDRRAFRKYEFELSYTFKKRAGTAEEKLVLRKEPGDICGQPFEIAELNNCEVVLLDHTEAIQVDYLKDCRVFIGACCDSVFVRNCERCTFTIACKQLRTRECEDCTFYLYSMTEPVIEMSTDVRFAPFNGAYPEHLSHMEEAGLDPAMNLWFAVFDFNDDAKTGKNWKLLAEIEEEAVWCAGSDMKMTVSTIPRVPAGSIPIPSEVEAAASAAANGTLQSFALGTSQADAAAAYAAAHKAEEEMLTSLNDGMDRSLQRVPTEDVVEKTNVSVNSIACPSVIFFIFTPGEAFTTPEDLLEKVRSVCSTHTDLSAAVEWLDVATVVRQRGSRRVCLRCVTKNDNLTPKSIWRMLLWALTNPEEGTGVHLVHWVALLNETDGLSSGTDDSGLTERKRQEEKASQYPIVAEPKNSFSLNKAKLASLARPNMSPIRVREKSPATSTNFRDEERSAASSTHNTPQELERRVFLCNQQTKMAQTMQQDLLEPRGVGSLVSARASMPPFNKRDDVPIPAAMEVYNVPVFSISVKNTIMSLFEENAALRATAVDLGIPLPEYRLDTFVQRKVASSCRYLVAAAKRRADFGTDLMNQRATARLEGFIDAFVALAPGDMKTPGEWNAFVCSHAVCGQDWPKCLHFEELLPDVFGFEVSTAAELRKDPIAIKDPISGQFKTETLEHFSLRWICKALTAFGPSGCFTDVVNLIFV